MKYLIDQKGAAFVLELALVASVLALAGLGVYTAFHGKKTATTAAKVVVSSTPSPASNSSENVPARSSSYYLAVINKVGSPPGFTVDLKSEEIQNGVGENPSARLAYLGNGTYTQVRDYMLQKLLAVGFHNAAWRDASGPAVAAGVFATCSGTAVFVRVDQADDDPIDIQVWAANYPNSPSCPLL